MLSKQMTAVRSKNQRSWRLAAFLRVGARALSDLIHPSVLMAGMSGMSAMSMMGNIDPLEEAHEREFAF